MYMYKYIEKHFLKDENGQLLFIIKFIAYIIMYTAIIREKFAGIRALIVIKYSGPVYYNHNINVFNCYCYQKL